MEAKITIDGQQMKIELDDETVVHIIEYDTHTVLTCDDWTGMPMIVWLRHKNKDLPLPALGSTAFLRGLNQ